MAYDIGDRIRFKVAFTEVGSETPADPSGITVKIRTPAGVQTSYVYGVDAVVVRTGVGLYHIEIDITASGVWSHKWFGTGDLVVAEEDSIAVRSTKFT